MKKTYEEYKEFISDLTSKGIIASDLYDKLADFEADKDENYDFSDKALNYLLDNKIITSVIFTFPNNYVAILYIPYASKMEIL